jgi:hypothetical protein
MAAEAAGSRSHPAAVEEDSLHSFAAVCVNVSMKQILRLASIPTSCSMAGVGTAEEEGRIRRLRYILGLDILTCCFVEAVRKSDVEIGRQHAEGRLRVSMIVLAFVVLMLLLNPRTQDLGARKGEGFIDRRSGVEELFALKVRW